MNHSVRITILVENSVNRCRLLAEHGLCYLVQHGPSKVLFDAGQSHVLLHNARMADIDLSKLDAIALSHGHYDHSGGLASVLSLTPKARVYAHPASLDPHYTVDRDSNTRSIGIPTESRECLLRQPDRLVLSKQRSQIIEGLFLTGEIPRNTGFEDVGGNFTTDENGLCEDPLRDDQALYFDSPNGVVVLLGCAHSGIINTLNHILRQTGGRPFHAVLGGMHLLNASPERMQKTMQALRQMEIHQFHPGHCTGSAAMLRLWQEFPEKCHPLSVGQRIDF